MPNDIVDLVLKLVRQQNQVETREDSVIRILKSHSESMTIIDTSTFTSLNAHPVKWGDPTTGKWDLFTWG